MAEKAKVDFDGKQKTLSGFPIGANVYCRDPRTKRWSCYGTIVAKKNNQTYQVKINGRLFLRNRMFLRLCRKDPEDPVADRNIPEDTGKPELCRSKRKRTPKRTY